MCGKVELRTANLNQESLLPEQYQGGQFSPMIGNEQRRVTTAN